MQVISRIFYTVNINWSGKITIPEIRRSNLLQVRNGYVFQDCIARGRTTPNLCFVIFQTIALLEEEDDINQITDYFSYEHFYVIYCKFWELDKDHDLFIDEEDLSRHNDHGMPCAVVTNVIMLLV